MNMPAYQPPPGTDVVPLDPPRLRDLFAVLDRPSYQVTPGGAVRLQGYVWAPEGEVFSPAARRAVYDAVEAAAAAVEALGWVHAGAVEIALAERPQHTFESTPTRVGARVVFTLQVADDVPVLEGRIVSREAAQEQPTMSTNWGYVTLTTDAEL